MELNRIRHNYLIFFLPAIVGAFSGNLFNLIPEAAIPITLFQVGLIFGIGATLIYRLFSTDFTFRIPPLLVEFTLFYAILFFSLTYSDNQSEGLFFLVRTSFIALFGYLLFNAMKIRKDVLFVGNFVAYISIIVAIFGIYAMLNNPMEIAQNITSTTGSVKNRAIGVEEDPNVFASYFIFPFLFLLSKYYSSDVLKKKALFVSMLIIITIAIALTYSRSVMLSIFVGSSIIVFVNRDYKFPLLVILVFIIALLSSETVRLLTLTVLDRVVDLFGDKLDDSNQTRVLLFMGALSMIANNFFIGIGFKSFPVYFKQNFDIQDTIGVYQPHNMFYQVFAEQGFIGFSMFAALYLLVLILIWKQYKYDKLKNKNISLSLSLLTTLIAFTIFYSLYGGAFTDSRIFIIGSMILAYSFINQNSTNNSGSELEKKSSYDELYNG